ncbi:MAG: dihydrolipoamide acetyltransferase, partial [Betaproteobacteria bacterium]|nr:dihydrolipoamide acetyltransferase [Betaproteobacteria bacterium]
MALVEVKVPDIGDFDEVAVIELLVKVGDTVKAEQSLITVESDKASMEIPSSTAGVVKELRVKLGDKVKEGSVVLMVEASGAVAASPSAPATAPAAAPVAAAPATAPAAVAAAPAASGPVEVLVPDIGDFKDVAVIEIFVKPGDAIKMEQSLITVESDKAAMEIPSSAAGVLKELKVKIGDKVNIGDLLAILEGNVAAAAPAAVSAVASGSAAPAAVSAPVTAPTTAAAAASAPAHNPGASTLGLPHASPSVRKFARELGVPLEEVKGNGPKGRITQEDVQAFTKAVMTGATQTKAQAAKAPAGGDGAALGLIPWPKVDFAKFGPIERKELGRIKKISGANLLRNAIMIPAV